jgi:hypothetical protein
MTVYVADAHAHVQRLVSVVEMATVLVEYTTEEQRSVVRFLWAKGFNAKDIHKEMFLVYGRKCLSRKAVHNLVEKFSQGRSKVVDPRVSWAGILKLRSSTMWRRVVSQADTNVSEKTPASIFWDPAVCTITTRLRSWRHGKEGLEVSKGIELLLKTK